MPPDVALEQERKTHRTACVLMPPEEVWGPIEAIRRVHDPQVGRWMPHVTLLYPFVAEGRLAEAAERLADAVAAVEPFEVELGEFGWFVHGRGSATLWLRPEPAEAVRRLQAALQGAMPWCDDVSRFAGGFTPHLSVGKFAGREAVEAAAARLGAGWEPVRFAAREVALIARPTGGRDRFGVRQRVALGAR